MVVDTQNLVQSPNSMLSIDFNSILKGNKLNVESKTNKDFRELFNKEISKRQTVFEKELPNKIILKDNENHFSTKKVVSGNREIKGISRKKSSSEMKANSHEDTCEDANDEKKIDFESLASLLGISVQQLTTLVEALGLDFAQTIDYKETAIMFDKLGDFLGLNPQQNNVLIQALDVLIDKEEKLSENININTEESNPDTVIQKAVEKSDSPVYIKHLEISTKENHAVREILSKISTEIKSKIQQLTGELQQSIETLDEYLNKGIMIQENEFSNELNMADGDTPNYDSVSLQKSNDGDGVSNKSSLEKTIAIETTKTDNLKTASAKHGLPDEFDLSELDFQKTPESLTHNPEVRISNPYYDLAPVEEVSVQKESLLYQVIENAKVILDGDKSEMVINLKPDSLGKLLMKVVTENGIVKAKLVAENQQVRQVLESSLNILRDSLEKQGMSIQELSVSVRDNNPGGYDSREEFEKEKGRANSSKSIKGHGNGTLNETLVTERFTGHYGDGSTINLTA